MANQVKGFLMQAAHFLSSKASFSPCGMYRWSLRRKWSKSNKRTLLFVGLNPSIATGEKDDPTLRRLLRFSRGWGYGELIVVNLFARISKTPEVLIKCAEPIGVKNDHELFIQFCNWSQTSWRDLCFGWGERGVLFQRNLEVMEMVKFFWNVRQLKFFDASGPFSMGLTRNGNPRHPLYLSKKEQMKSFAL